MEPNYHNFQLVILDKRSMNYEPGDVVAFRCSELGATLIKRITAIPGDSVCISNGRMYVNGQPSTVYPTEHFVYAGLLDKPIFLGDGEYIVIGDNTAASKDSRYENVGIVFNRQIIGKVVAP